MMTDCKKCNNLLIMENLEKRTAWFACRRLHLPITPNYMKDCRFFVSGEPQKKEDVRTADGAIDYENVWGW